MTELHLPERSEVSFNETLDSLTGHEEDWVQAKFGAIVYRLLEDNPGKAVRAVAAVVYRRALTGQGVADPAQKAYDAVMERTARQVTDLFPDDEDEVVPDEPVTVEGKGDSSSD